MQLPYFFEPLLSKEDSFYTLSENTSKHCVQVLRMHIGDKILLTDGKGMVAKVALTALHKTKAQAKIEDVTFQPPTTQKKCIGIGLLKNNARLEWFLEKATEFGITEIIPMITEHTEKNHFRYDRSMAVIAAAMIQSQQCYLPILHDATPFKQVIQQTNYQQKLIAHCENTPKTELANTVITDNALLLIGPEGDFSSEEIQDAQENNYVAVGLGTNRLRTETAAIAGAVLMTLK